MGRFPETCFFCGEHARATAQLLLFCAFIAAHAFFFLAYNSWNDSWGSMTVVVACHVMNWCSAAMTDSFSRRLTCGGPPAKDLRISRFRGPALSAKQGLVLYGLHV